ncbi:MAG TPA: NAD(P)-binding domain-containing protein [Acidimicrobiales bacterium]|nr:NAD(P)-binding domain-containing protein [Acidimicrobiales bacterium]
MERSSLPVAVIGAGPVGLAAAAHLHERGIPFVVFEVGDDIAASVRAWAHVRLFSPWGFNIDPEARRLLETGGWTAPDPDEHPTGGDLIEQYLEPLALLPGISANLRTKRLVTWVTRLGVDKVRTAGRAQAPFVLATDSPYGFERTLASAVIDASGTWTQPNPLGADGRPAIGERRANGRIDYGIPDVLGRDRPRYSARRIAVVGSGHSAQNLVRDLAALAVRHPCTSVTWVLRRARPGQTLGGGRDDQLPERARLGAEARALVASRVVAFETGFHVDELVTADHGVVLLSADGRKLGPFDRVVAATGFRPDLGMLG